MMREADHEPSRVARAQADRDAHTDATLRRRDTYITEVMSGSWRRDALCVLMPNTFALTAPGLRRHLCNECEFASPCLWASLIEDRAFRGLSPACRPPSFRGATSTAKRRQLLDQFCDEQLITNYRTALARTQHPPAT